jgi:circadian clock protein KaiC
LTVEDFERKPTGIEGLDNMIEGGIPRGDCVLVTGGPGTGKSTFAIQFLVTGCTGFDETGVYVTFEEREHKVIRNMKRFGWDLEPLIDSGRLILLSLIPSKSFASEYVIADTNRVQHRFDMEEITKFIEERVQDSKAERVVVDSITALGLMTPDEMELRQQVLELIGRMGELHTTCIFTAEKTETHGVEEYLSDGVIALVNTGGGKFPTMRIVKLRGTDHDRYWHPYEIGPEGIKVFYRERAFEEDEGL